MFQVFVAFSKLIIFYDIAFEKAKLTPCGQTLKLHICDNWVYGAQKEDHDFSVIKQCGMAPKTHWKPKLTINTLLLQGPNNKLLTDIYEIRFRTSDERQKAYVQWVHFQTHIQYKHTCLCRFLKLQWLLSATIPLLCIRQCRATPRGPSAPIINTVLPSKGASVKKF